MLGYFHSLFTSFAGQGVPGIRKIASQPQLESRICGQRAFVQDLTLHGTGTNPSRYMQNPRWT